MKKILLTFIFSVVTLFAGTIIGDANNVETTIENEDQTRIVEYHSLSEQEKDYFQNKGFDENDEYFTTTVVQMPETIGEVATRAVNVVVLTGSTKKVSNTSGYTEFIISATQAGFSRLDCKLDMGSVKTVTSTITPYGSPLVYGGGIYSFYTGASRYLAYKLTIQYNTSWGPGSVNSPVGGLTLGS